MSWDNKTQIKNFNIEGFFWRRVGRDNKGLSLYCIIVATGSETGSESGGSEDVSGTDSGEESDDDTSSEDEDALEKLQKRFGVEPTKKPVVEVSKWY